MTIAKAGFPDGLQENNNKNGEINFKEEIDVDKSFFKVLESMKNGQLSQDAKKENDAKVFKQMKYGKYR